MTAIEPDLLEVVRAVAAMQTFVSDASMSAFLEGPVADILRERIDQRFATEGNGSWAPLKERTVWIREHHGFPGEHPINERTGGLKHWLESHGFLTIAPEGPTYALPGPTTGDPYLDTKLATAQDGRADPETVPRPVLGLDEIDAGLVGEAIGEWFLQTTAAFGVEVS